MRQIIQVLASTFLFFIIFGSFSSSFAQEKAAPVFPSDAYVATVTTSILPIMEAPGMRYNLSKNTLDWSEGLEGTVVYGNMLVVRPSSKKDWVELLSNENGESLGFVPLKGLSKTQPYESTPYTWYVVAKDNAELSLEPDVKQKGSPLASFKLIKGELVPSFGKRGTKLLLRFDTLNSESGIGARYAWADEGDFILLSNYQPASGEFDPSWLPSAIRCLGYGDGEEGKGICPAVTVPKNISSGLQSHGFYIDGTPVIIDVIDDDMGDSYLNIHNQQPVFISTDIFLHYFHLIFNRLLETLELASLEPGLEENLKAAISQLNSISSNLTPNLLGPWQTAVDMFSVPSSLLSEKSGTVPLSPKASKEVTLIKEATVVGMPSPVFETLTDYTMFKPRGHYTKSPVLSRYFLAMNYIGTAELMLFDLKGDPITPNIQTAALICMTLDSLGDKWLSLEEPIDYLIGASNTGDGKKFRALVKQHIGTLNDPTSLVKLSDPNALTALSDSIKKEIEGPQIQSVAGVDKPGEDFSERSPVFRISGKRFSLDAFIFNQLTTPRVGTPELSRAMPKGTDVMAILGSEVASQYAEKNFDIPNYKENYQLLKQLAPGILSKDKTVYSLWLSAFQAGFKNSGANYFFYKDNLWSYKKLLTALASYAEIKHDTILYVEQSMSELGDGMLMAGDFAPPFPRGFVEPDPQVYQA
ncbi:MAG: DUF3160 domain-containing protein, partial [Deltaproteobacteria bacterium]|nr:DUF3160 domain-containing protein [Deltaproteobacteria bacterium]